MCPCVHVPGRMFQMCCQQEQSWGGGLRWELSPACLSSLPLRPVSGTRRRGRGQRASMDENVHPGLSACGVSRQLLVRALAAFFLEWPVLLSTHTQQGQTTHPLLGLDPLLPETSSGNELLERSLGRGRHSQSPSTPQSASCLPHLPVILGRPRSSWPRPNPAPTSRPAAPVL